MNMKSSIALAFGICSITSAMASGVTGVWKGHVAIDMAKINAAKSKTDPKQKQMVEKMTAMVRKMQFNLTLQPSKTFTMVLTGQTPGKAHTGSGTWNQQGNIITINLKVNDGKPASGASAQPQNLVLSKDGKSLTLSPKGTMGGKIVFVR